VRSEQEGRSCGRSFFRGCSARISAVRNGWVSFGQNGAESILAGFAIWCISFLISSPDWNLLSSRFFIFSQQVADPFYRDLEKAFLGFRILIPSIAWLLHFNRWGGLALIYACSALSLAAMFHLLRREIVPFESLWFCLTMSLTPFVQGSTVYIGYPDAAGWLMVAFAMLDPRPIFWGIAALLIQMNDERGLLALPLALAVVAYPARHSLRQAYLSLRGLTWALIIGFTAGQLLRHSIASGLVGGRPIEGNIYPEPANLSIFYLFLGLVVSYKALWPFAIYVIARTFRDPTERKAYWFWFGVVGWGLVVILICSYVSDYWRSLAALFPLFNLFLLQAENKYFNPTSLRQCILSIALISLILPQFAQMGNHVAWIRPLPVGIYELMKGKSILPTWLRALQ